MHSIAKPCFKLLLASAFLLSAAMSFGQTTGPFGITFERGAFPKTRQSGESPISQVHYQVSLTKLTRGNLVLNVGGLYTPNAIYNEKDFRYGWYVGAEWIINRKHARIATLSAFTDIAYRVTASRDESSGRTLYRGPWSWSKGYFPSVGMRLRFKVFRGLQATGSIGAHTILGDRWLSDHGGVKLLVVGGASFGLFYAFNYKKSENWRTEF